MNTTILFIGTIACLGGSLYALRNAIKCYRTERRWFWYGMGLHVFLGIFSGIFARYAIEAILKIVE